MVQSFPRFRRAIRRPRAERKASLHEYDIDAAMAQLQRDMYGGSDEDESETGEQVQEEETVEKIDSDEDETEEEAAA